VDAVDPTITVAIAAAAVNEDGTSDVTFTFSEAPSGFELSDIDAVGGTVSDLSPTEDPLVWTATFTPQADFDGEGSVSVAAGTFTDAAGNENAVGASDTIDVDAVDPTITVDIVDASLSDGDTSSRVKFTFSEVPYGFSNAALMVVGGTLSTVTLDLELDPTGRTYTATFTAADGFTGTGSVSVAPNSYTDAALNPGGAGTDNVAIDTNNDPDRVSPTDIILTPDPVPMQNNFSFLFGATLAAADPDPGAFTYSFADGSDQFTATSGSNSNLFTISGDRLTSATNLGSNVNYTLTLKVTQAGDPASASYLETFHIITGKPNNSPDDLSGGTVDDVLYGANGRDVMFGGDGNDTLFGQADGDILQGNSGNDTLDGGNGSDTLVGGADADTLIGGMDADQFVFMAPADGADTISDFSAAEGDKITISKSGFGNDFTGSSLDENQFVSGSALGGSPPAATQSEGQFLYNSSTGELFWDADGTGDSGAIKLAVLNNQPSLTASAFLLV
jgi:Ca2+-binding RTX toxin-like protein